MTFVFDKISPVYLTNRLENSFWSQKVSLSKGERLNVFAPSGSGKTSLFRLMIGERIKHTGSLSFEGNDLSKMNVEAMADYRSNIISFVSQDLSLFENLSVKENLSLFDNGSFDLGRGIEELMLRDNIDKKTSLLSQGEKQRLAILRALNQPHQILVLDEPFSHLDNELTKKAWDLIDMACAHNKVGLILLSLEKADFGHWDSQISLS